MDLVADLLMFLGAALALIAGIGLQRFPDVFARMHAATKPASLGLLLVMLGAMLRLDDVGDDAKLLLIVVLQFITAPIGSHLLGRAAYLTGTEMDQASAIDQLAGAVTYGDVAHDHDQPDELG